MLEAGRIRHKALKRYYEKDAPRGIRADWIPKVRRILQALDTMSHPEELYGLPSFNLHLLKGDRRGTWAVTIKENWRVTFKWDDEGPFDVDMEDYHD